MEDVRSIVIDYIVSDWKRFARKMDIDENKIDQIDYDERRIADKTRRVTMIISSTTTGNDFIRLIMNGLEKMPRFDIIRVIKALPNWDVIERIWKNTQADEARHELKGMLVSGPGPVPGVRPTMDVSPQVNNDQDLLISARNEIENLKTDNANANLLMMPPVLYVHTQPGRGIQV